MRLDSKKKKIILITLLLDVCLIICVVILKQEYDKVLFEKNIGKLYDLDVRYGNYMTQNMSNGVYNRVEKAIKDYMDDYQSKLNDLNKLMSENNLNNILSIEYLSSNNDNLVNVLNDVNRYKMMINDKINELVYLSSRDGINNNIYYYTDDSYYINLYKKVFKFDLEKNIFELNEKKINTNYVLNIYIEAIEFLNNNKDNYLFEDGKLQFKEQDLLDRYNAIVSKIKG